MKHVAAAILAMLVAAVFFGAYRASRRTQEIAVEPPADPRPSPEMLSSIPLEQDHEVGAGRSFAELTVFPILAKNQPDLGEFTTLDEALAKKTAEVREESE